MASTIMSRRIVTGLAAATLAIGLTACSEAEEGVDSAGSAVQDAGDTIASEADEAGDAISSEVDGAGSEGAEGGTTEVEGADGQTFQVPAALGEAINNYSADFGAPVDVQEGGNGGTLATFEGGRHLVYSEESGAQPLVGKIAETWVGEGALDADIGLPTAPEQPAPEGNGWMQEFTRGAIGWVTDGSGEFSAQVQPN